MTEVYLGKASTRILNWVKKYPELYAKKTKVQDLGTIVCSDGIERKITKRQHIDDNNNKIYVLVAESIDGKSVIESQINSKNENDPIFDKWTSFTDGNVTVYRQCFPEHQENENKTWINGHWSEWKTDVVNDAGGSPDEFVNGTGLQIVEKFITNDNEQIKVYALSFCTENTEPKTYFNTYEEAVDALNKINTVYWTEGDNSYITYREWILDPVNVEQLSNYSYWPSINPNGTSIVDVDSAEWIFSDGKQHDIYVTKLDSGENRFELKDEVEKEIDGVQMQMLYPPTVADDELDLLYSLSWTWENETGTKQYSLYASRIYVPEHWEDENGNWIRGSWSDFIIDTPEIPVVGIMYDTSKKRFVAKYQNDVDSYEYITLDESNPNATRLVLDADNYILAIRRWTNSTPSPSSIHWVPACNPDGSPFSETTNAEWIFSDGKTGSDWGIVWASDRWYLNNAHIALSKYNENHYEIGSQLIDKNDVIGYLWDIGYLGGEGEKIVTACRKYTPGHWEDADGNWINGSWGEWKIFNVANGPSLEIIGWTNKYWSDSDWELKEGDEYHWLIVNGDTPGIYSTDKNLQMIHEPSGQFCGISGFAVRTWNNTKPTSVT